jgi:large subunit ribosomal protein L9
MEVILLERIEKLGQMGEVVNVKPGFARNYLLPQRKALRATKDNLAHFEGRRAQLEADNLKRREEAASVAKKLDGLKVVIVRQASDTDQLYGSVTTRDIAEAITAAGFTVDKRQVSLDRPIKAVGLHPIRVVLHPEVVVTVTTNVARSEEEAEAQARGERIVREPGEEDAAAVDAAALFEPGSRPGEAAGAQRGPGDD